MAGLQDGRSRVLVEWQDGAHIGPSHGHLHGQVKQSRVAMPHAVLVQQILHDLAASGLVGDAEGLVLDVRPQAVGIDLDGGLKEKVEHFL